jgi:outer membrane protein assembly factor BamB
VKTSVAKYFIFLLTSVIQINNCFAQKDVIVDVTTNKKPVGIYLINQQPINAVEYTFPERIHDFKVDTLNSYLTIKLRGLSKNGKWLDNKGSIVRYSTKENKVLWSKKIAYQGESIDAYGGVTLYSSQSKSYSMDNETGEPLWEAKNSLLYSFPNLKRAVGYKLRASKKDENVLECINLKDGKALWEREISREYSWNDAFKLNDSTLLIAAAGLHTVSLNDGAGWDYYTKTGEKDYTGAAFGTGLGIAAGLLTGSYYIPTGHNTVVNISSNVLVDNTAFYFASKVALAKLDKDGFVIWKTELPEKETSKSLIFKQGPSVILINLGYANMGDRTLNIGLPFIASFDIITGKSNFKTNISAEKEKILDYEVVGKEVFFVFTDRVEKYSINDGKLLASQKYDLTKSGEQQYFLGNQVFVKNGNTYSSLTTLSPDDLYVYTKNGKAFQIDHALAPKGEVNSEDFYISYIRTKDFTFIKRQNQTIVIDREGKEKANFSVVGKSVLLNGKLYTASENSFLETDLSALLNNSTK